MSRLRVSNNIIISGGIGTFYVEAVLYSPKLLRTLRENKLLVKNSSMLCGSSTLVPKVKIKAGPAGEILCWWSNLPKDNYKGNRNSSEIK